MWQNDLNTFSSFSNMNIGCLGKLFLTEPNVKCFSHSQHTDSELSSGKFSEFFTSGSDTLTLGSAEVGIKLELGTIRGSPYC